MARSARYMPEEMQRFRSESEPSYVDYLSDEHVAELMVFHAWLLSERFKDAGRVIAEEARKDWQRIRGWVSRDG